jgi:hypothetical protein
MQYYGVMNKAEKLLQQMRQNPRDWRIEEIKTVALHFKVSCRNTGGSHLMFGVCGVAEKLCVPAHKPIKPVYIRQFVALIDKVKELSSE